MQACYSLSSAPTKSAQSHQKEHSCSQNEQSEMLGIIEKDS